jgi:NAD+ diphosphatase
MLDGSHQAGLLAPQPFAIAHHLLKGFMEEGPAVLD